MLFVIIVYTYMWYVWLYNTTESSEFSNCRPYLYKMEKPELLKKSNLIVIYLHGKEPFVNRLERRMHKFFLITFSQ